jgi:hypothetical protein
MMHGQTSVTFSRFSLRLGTVWCVSVTIAAVEKQCVAYSECVLVSLGLQHAIRMRHPIRGLPHEPHSSTLSHKRYNFKKKLQNANYLFLLSPQFLSEIF